MNQARLLEGKVLAQKIQERIKTEIETLTAQGAPRPGLLALQASEDPASSWYIGQQEKLAAKLGIHFERIGSEKIRQAGDLIQNLKQHSGKHDGKFHGIFVAMPLPKGFDADEVLGCLDEKYDVEGIHPASLGLIVLRRARLIPPTAYAALSLIEWAARESGTELRGRKAVIVGQSAIVGRPLQMLLGERRVTTLVCNTGTAASDLQRLVAEGDIVVGCAGQPGLIKGSWIREGAVVIDVGTTDVGGKLAGDVEFEEAAKRASFITPVPGGVGPLTVTMLMQNLMHAYKWQRGTPA